MKYNEYLEPMEEKSDSELKRIKIYLWFLIITIVVLSIQFDIALSKKDNKTEDVILIEQEKYFEVSDTLTMENVYRYALQINLKYPLVFLAQVSIESGNLTSQLTKSNNNICGMGQATSRATTNIKNSSRYGLYNSWKECVIDYAFMQMSFFKGNTEEEYLQWIDKVYSEDENYIQKIKCIQSQLQDKYDK